MNEIKKMTQFNSFPIMTRPLRNYRAVAARTFTSDISVLPKDVASIMPNTFTLNTYGGLLTIDPEGSTNVFRTHSRYPLNIIYRIRLDSVVINTSRNINMGLRRGNEAIPIPGTLQVASVQRAPEYTVESVVGVQGATFTSGEGDSFNLVGFVPIIYNTSDREIEIPAGSALRIDFFSVG